MKFNALFSALLVAGSLTVVSSSAHATLGLLGGLGSICTLPATSTGIDCSPSLGGGLFGGNGSRDLFGNLPGGSGGTFIGPPSIIRIGSVSNTPILGGGNSGSNCDLFGNFFGGGNNGIDCNPFGGNNGGGIGGGNGNNCNPPGGGGTTGGGNSPVPEPGSIALLALGATALAGTALRRVRK